MGIETGALIGGGALLGSALIGSKSASKAADAQVRAAQEAAGVQYAQLDEARRQYDLARGDQAPWLQEGTGAVRTLGDLIRSGSIYPNFSGENLENEPGYQFRLAEGQKAIDNAARARGTYLSPMTVKALLRYGQDYASGEYNNAYQRDLTNKLTKFNMLSGLAGTGQAAANANASIGSNYTNATQAGASNIGNLITGAGNARGASGIAAGNAWQNALMQGANMYNQNRMLNTIGSWYGNGGNTYSAQPVNWQQTGDFPMYGNVG